MILSSAASAAPAKFRLPFGVSTIPFGFAIVPAGAVTGACQGAEDRAGALGHLRRPGKSIGRAACSSRDIDAASRVLRLFKNLVDRAVRERDDEEISVRSSVNVGADAKASTK
jgi:hypothetical protein